MSFDFPASPTIGQLYPSTVTAGAAQYVWNGSTWVATGSVDNYVRKSGDTMSGALVLPGAPTANLQSSTKKYVDDAITTVTSAKVSKSGDTMTGNLVAPAVLSGTTATSGTYYFGSNGSRYLTCDGTNYTFSTGALIVNGSTTVAGSLVGAGNVFSGSQGGHAGVYYFGTGAKYLTCDGTNYAFAGGQLTVNGPIVATGNLTGNALLNVQAGVWFQYPNWGFSFNAANGDTALIRAGAQWTMWRGGDGSLLQYIGNAYKPGGGPWTDISDARIKTVLGDYQNGLDAINALRPVRFTYRGNDTHEPPTGRPIDAAKTLQASLKPQLAPEQPTKTATEPAVVPYWNSLHRSAATQGTEFIGLVAQDCEAAMPELISKAQGYIDGKEVQDLRSVDTGPLIFALINSCKELSARMVALETKLAEKT